jgi:uncharacterized membrane protein
MVLDKTLPTKRWFLSKLAIFLTCLIGVVLFARVLSYLLVEYIPLSTYDSMVTSVLKTFLNESQYKAVVQNVKASGSSKKMQIQRETPLKSAVGVLEVNKEPVTADAEEKECAVCKYVMPTVVRY